MKTEAIVGNRGAIAGNVTRNDAFSFAGQNETPGAALNDSFLAAKGTDQVTTERMDGTQLIVSTNVHRAISHE